MAEIEVGTAPRAATALTPVRPKDRIYNLDVLRGWAILGILAVNAISFAGAHWRTDIGRRALATG